MAKTIYRLGFVIALSFGVAISAWGQGRGFRAPMPGLSPQVRSFSASQRGVSGFGRINHNGFRRGSFASPPTGTPLNPDFRPLHGVPGLGFDFAHLAAIERPFRGRFGHQPGGLFFAPLFFDALPLYYPYDSEVSDYYREVERPQFLSAPPQPQPNVTVPAEPAPRESVTPQAPPPPPPELGQLILVRGDGQVLLAVAFTVRNGQLTYITNEGIRHSFPVSELDKDATRQMNDANGTSVSIPN
jgi:hypothetical protein